jgi:tetratricopeptide (TPR) repeat protein
MKCLEKDRRRRYETANGLTMDLHRYMHDEPVHACPPSVAYRCRKFARRHGAALAGAAAVGVAILLAVGTLGWTLRDRAARQSALEAEVARALDDAERACGRDQLSDARAAVQHAQALLARGGSREALRKRLSQWQVDLRMADRLDEIRLDQSAVKDDHFDLAGAEPAYRAAFQRYGVDVEKLDAQKAADFIRVSPIRDRLIAALDGWLLAKHYGHLPGNEVLLEVLQRADANPWRTHFREAFRRKDHKTIRDLAQNPEVLAQPPGTLVFLAGILSEIPDADLSINVLRRAQQRHPDDFWINETLGRYLMQKDSWSESVGFYRAAVALRPESPGVHINLGSSLHLGEKFAEADAEFRQAALLKPDFALAPHNLGDVFRDQGRWADAEAEYRAWLRLQPDNFYGHNYLARVLIKQGRAEEAKAELENAIRLRPAGGDPWYALGLSYAELEQWEAAAEAFEKVTSAKPDSAWMWYYRAQTNLQAGNRDEYRRVCAAMLSQLGDTKDPQVADRIVYACVTAADAVPDMARLVRLAEIASTAWKGNERTLAATLYRAGRFDEALQRFQQLRTELTNDPWESCFLAMTYHRLGRAERAGRRLDAVLGWREWHRQQPRDTPHATPWWIATEMTQLVAEAERLLDEDRLDPYRRHAERGEWDKAAGEFARAFQTKPPDDLFRWFEYAIVLVQVGDTDGYLKLCAQMRERVGDSQDFGKVATLAHTCALAPRALGDPGAVVQLAQQRTAMTPNDPSHRLWSAHVLALAHYRAGHYREAVDCLSPELNGDPGLGYRIRNWLIAAMAHQRLGHGDEARRWLDKAEQWLKQKDGERQNNGSRLAPSGIGWCDWLGIQLLRREAEEALK